ncbi:hypothetical protein GGR51DRAFT_546367 [Nemania sp. FL0031]|nr:hypothetical protein GGR51DRAFT_546367 [Nemania sp. FL0031]
MGQPLLHELGLAIAEDFDKLLEVERNNEWLKAQDITSEAERFQLWAQNLGLFQQGHASLDYRVRDAVLVRDRLAELLRELAEHTRELLLILLGEKKPAEEIDGTSDNSSSSGASSESSESSIHDRLLSDDCEFHETEYRFQSLTERLNALYSLATKIRNPKNRPSLTNDRLYKNIPEQSRSEYIHDREEIEVIITLSKKIEPGDSVASDEAISEEIFSQYASPNCWIVRRTGKANAKRKQQLVYWKTHALRLGQVERQPTKKVEPTPVEQNVTPSQHISPSNLGRVQPADPSLATSASKLPSLKPDDLKSVISHQSRVSTTISVQENDLNWPPPPAIAGNNGYFECPYCKTICPIKYLEKGAWEKHIIHDLQAYHCTYEQCQDPNRLYGSKQEWLNHESQHNRVWICQGHDAEFETQPDYIAHLEAEHPESQTDRPSDVLIGTAILEMQQHIAFHLVRLALLALPPSDSGSQHENYNESMQSDQPQQRGRTQSIFNDFRLRRGEKWIL